MMPQFTSAYSGLVRRYDEIDAIQRMARRLSGLAPTRTTLAQIDALCRGGVVLLSSHIEGYFEDLTGEALDRIHKRRLPKAVLGKPFKYYMSQDLIRAVRNAGSPATMVTKLEEMLHRDEHVWGNSPVFDGPLGLSPFADDFSNPNHKRIKKLMGRFGYRSFESDLSRALAADFVPCRNMVDQVVDQRNKIAHGDSVTTGTPGDLNDMARLVRQYCRASDRAVGDWFRNQGCPIR